jgi:putative Mn2+ efflux pump MntP
MFGLLSLGFTLSLDNFRSSLVLGGLKPTFAQSPERADPNLTFARRGLPLPLSVDNVAAGTALGLSGYSPWLAPILFGLITFAVSIAGHQIGRTVAHFFDFIPHVNTDLMTGVAFAALAALMALGVTLPLSGD